MLNWWKARQKRVAARKSARDLRARFFDLQTELEPDAFIEVGAHEASASLRIRTIFPAIPIVAFEAHPANYEHYRGQIDFEALRIEYLNLAAADRTGEITFRVLRRHEGKLTQRGSILETVSASDMPIATVPAVALDDFFEPRMPVRPSMWIDVEGANREVLLGARQLLARAASVFIEVEEQPRWKDQWLAQDVLRFLEQYGLREVDRDSQFDRQYNILFARALSV
jgi:FkbM family methyltransferase